MRALIASILILLFVGVSHASVVNLRIVNGTEADNGEFPFAVSVHKSGQHICGASIISPFWLLSAAHCFNESADPSVYSFIHGDVDLESESKKEVYAKRFIRHEDYVNKNLFNDIALIELKEPLQFDEFTNQIGLPNSGVITAEGSQGIVVGWGLNEDGNVQRYLYKADVVVLSKEECAQRYEERNITIFSSLVCGDEDVGSKFCDGDSGGPLAQDGILIGIVKANDEFCKLLPDLYTEVSHYIGWISDNTGLEL